MVQTRAITESFDLYPSAVNQGGFGLNTVWTSLNGTAAIVAGRFTGSQAIQCYYNTQRVRVIPSTDSLVFGFAFMLNGTQSGGAPIVALRSSAGNVQWQLSVDQLFRLVLNLGYTSNANQIAYSDEAAIVLGTWHYIEVETFLHDSAGFIRVYLDGMEVSGLQFYGDTRASTDLDFGQIVLRSGDSPSHFFDDLYVEVDGTTRVGEGRMDLYVPNSTVSSTGFTPSTGSTIHGVIDEIPANATDWANATDAGSQFRVGLTDMVYAPEKIYGVQVEQLAQKTEAGTRTLRSKLFGLTGAVIGSERALTANVFTWNRDWFDKEPDNSEPWTLSSIVTAELGVEVVV